MYRYSLNTVADWLGCASQLAHPIRLFQHDSRQVEKGDLFFALKGERVDSHAFLKEVAAKGACGAVVSKEYRGEDYGLTLFPAPDVLAALHKMARIAFSEKEAKVIAVTGSVGKTTTKEFIATLLAGKFQVAKTPGNMNSQVGLPLFLLNHDRDEEILVLEMGMTHPGDIEKLIAIAPPDYALVTRIALAHAAFFPEGIERIAAAKAEIFSHPQMRLGFAHVEAMQFEPIRRQGKIVFGWETPGQEMDYMLRSQGEEFQIVARGALSPPFRLPFQAKHLCENFLAAAAIARELGMSWETLIAQASQLKVYKGRFELIERGGMTFVNDTYNANSTSTTAALLNLPKPGKEGKTVAVLGEMKELGLFSEVCHREVGEVALQCVDHLLCLGKECQPMVDLFRLSHKPVEWFLTLGEIKERVFQVAESGDVVLIKGSNSLQLWKILEE